MKLSSARLACARFSNGFPFSRSLARACFSTEGGLRSWSREVDIELHLPVEIKGVAGVGNARGVLAVRAEQDAALFVQRAQAVVKLPQSQPRAGLLQLLVDLRQGRASEGIASLCLGNEA